MQQYQSFRSIFTKAVAGALKAIDFDRMSPLTRAFYDVDDGEGYNSIRYSDDGDGYADAYKSSLWVKLCVEVRAESVASLPLRLYKKTNKNSTDGRDKEIPDHPITRLLDSVNPYILDKNTLWIATESSLATQGACYWYKVRNTYNFPKEIYVLDPRRVAPIPDKDTYIGGYLYKYDETKDPLFIHANDMVYYHYWNPDSPILGLSPLKAAMLSINTEKAAKMYNEQFFAKGARISGVLSTQQALHDSAGLAALRAEVKKYYAGLKNAHGVMILDQGLSYTPVQLGPKDVEFERGQRLNREEICAALKVPGPMVGDMARSTYTDNYTTARKSFWADTIVPHSIFLAEQLRWSILPDFGLDPRLYYLRFDTTRVQALQEDLTKAVDTLQKLLAAGIPLNEALAKLMPQFGPYDWGEVPVSFAFGQPQWSLLDQKDQSTTTAPTPSGASADTGVASSTPFAAPIPGAGAQPGSSIDTSGKADPVSLDLKRWRTKALKHLNAGKAVSVPFESDYIPSAMAETINFELKAMDDNDEATQEKIRALFEEMMRWLP